ncbi:hypothetical protein DFH06DRAFT_1471760 [Mycena polygramma]|nr:hypothetical protein DFH06DRAFT_1471760 [Mycena polygramma]
MENGERGDVEVLPSKRRCCARKKPVPVCSDSSTVSNPHSCLMPGRPRLGAARRWTHKKTRSTHLQLGEPTAPKDSVWPTLEQHGTFIVMDEDGKQHPFHLNDVATVVPGPKHDEHVCSPAPRQIVVQFCFLCLLAIMRVPESMV